MSSPHSSSRKTRASQQKEKPRSLSYSTLSARAKRAYHRTTNLVTDLRRGEASFTELLKKHHLGSRTARKYAGRDLLGGTRGKRVRASKADQRVRNLFFPTPSGDVPIRTHSSRDATKLSEFFHDREKLLRNKLSAKDFEARWRGVHVADQELFADASEIFRMQNADALRLEDLYSSPDGER